MHAVTTEAHWEPRRAAPSRRSRRRRSLVAAALAVGSAACLTTAPALAATPGPPSFSTATNLDTHLDQTRAVAIADLNGDGKPDLATMSQTGGLFVSLGTGGGGFAAGTNYPAPHSDFFASFVASVKIADVNGDGKPDVVSQDARNQIAVVWLGTGDGAFATGTGVALNSRPGCGLSSDNPCQASFPIDVGVGDFNEDGKPDILTSNTNTQNLSFVPGNGDGTFGAATQIPVGNGNNFGLATADLNHDGHLDAVVANESAQPGEIDVLFGTGNGGFSAPTRLPSVITLPQFTQIADFNEDGNPDILAGNGNFAGQMAIFLGDGHGGFGPAAVTDDGGNPSAFAISDLNGDGHLDLAITSNNRNSNNVGVMAGDGHGAFGPLTSYGIDNGDPSQAKATSPLGVAAGDINGDGLPDLVTANGGVGNQQPTAVKDLSVLLNTSTLVDGQDITLNAKVAAYVALQGGSGNFGDVKPGFTTGVYTTNPPLSIATTSPSGVLVTVQATNPANTDLGGLGPVTVLANPYLLSGGDSAAWTSLASPVPLYLSHGPVNVINGTAAYYKLEIPAGEVLTAGHTYSEGVTYTATSTLP